MIDHPSWHDQPFGEIVIDDTYRLKGKPAPAMVYDLGGNRGCFASYCKHLWPSCKVVSVEPHPDNYRLWQESAGTLPGVTCINAAIANGPVYFLEGANHGGHTFTSPSVGYTTEALSKLTGVSEIPGITVPEVFEKYPPGGRYYVKIDMEGAEESLFDHEPTNEILRGAEYLTVELHFFAAEGRPVPDGPRKPALMGTHGHVIMATLEWVYGFTETHNVQLELLPNSGMMWATKRKA